MVGGGSVKEEPFSPVLGIIAPWLKSAIDKSNQSIEPLNIPKEEKYKIGKTATKNDILECISDYAIAKVACEYFEIHGKSFLYPRSL